MKMISDREFYKWIVTIGLLLSVAIGCATLKDVVRTLDDAADIACIIFGTEHPEEFEHMVRAALPPGAASDAEKSGFIPSVLCEIKEVVQPFIDDQLRMQQAQKASVRSGMGR